MNDALFGCSGLVGTTLLRQHPFAVGYRSNDVAQCRGRRFETVVCAAAPAEKWLANRNPEKDEAGIRSLIDHLSTVQCRSLILISTIDVFDKPLGVDESTMIQGGNLTPYGRHRLLLEHAVREIFDSVLVVRLPGLVGPGLKKNVIYDLHNEHETSLIDSRGTFQFYPLVNLWPDILVASRAGLPCVHLTAEPVDVATVALAGFGREFANHVTTVPARYDMHTLHARLYGQDGPYVYSARESLLAIRAYAQSEPRRREVMT